jgi:electron transfer flavoprotein beta subunit
VRVAVCVKQVKVLGDEVEFRADGLDVDPDYLDRALNEWDACAVEEALLIRDAGDGEVVVLTVGDEEADAVLRRSLAMGADRAIRIESDAGDPIGVARALAEAIDPLGADLVLCGVQSSDAVQAATGTALAEMLGLPRVAVVTKVELSPGGGQATVRRELEGGLVDVVSVDLPAVLTIQTGINQPRYATLRAIKQAEQLEIDVREQADAGPPAYTVRRMFVPSKGAGAELLPGSPADIAARIAEILRERLA